MKRRALRVAVVGLGLIGTRRVRVLRETPGAELAAIVDTDQARVEAVGRDTGARAFARWENAVCADDVDAIIVATPNDCLAPIACAALESGKHVLCEKPPGRNAAEARAMLEAAESSGRVLAFGFNHRHAPGVSKALEIVRSGGVGRLLHLRARYGHGARPGFEREWRADRERAGGGELMDQGVHLVDLARLFLGEVERVYAVTRTAFWPIAPLEDNAFCLLEHAGGTVSMLHASLTQWKNLFSIEIFGEQGAVLVEGLGGSYGQERAVWQRRCPESGPPDQDAWEFETELSSWRHEWRAFLDAVEGTTDVLTRAPLASAADGLAVMEIVESLYDSAREGRPVECPRTISVTSRGGIS